MLAVVFATAPAASAAGAGTAPNLKVRYGASANWAGYAVAGSGTYTTVSASWIQPAVDCTQTPSAYSSFWVGLDGDTSNTVEQTGTEANCISGSARYAGWYEMFPKRPVISANPMAAGDSITASVTAGAKGRFQLALTDNTQGWSVITMQRKKAAKHASAEVIAEAPSTRKRVLPLADFASVSFGGVSVNGAQLSEATPGIEPITMTAEGTVKATPGPLSGGGFAVTWHHT
jgi:Peptidase A4 family